jgi:hypothetical protein
MAHPFSSLGSLGSWGLAFALGTVGQADLVREVHPLGGLTRHVTPTARVATLPLPASLVRSDGGLAAADGQEPEPAFHADQIAEILRSTIAPAEWESPDRSMDVVDLGGGETALAVVAPPAIQAEIRRLVAYLAAHLAREVRVRVDAYSIERAGADLLATSTGSDAAAALADLERAGSLRRVSRAVRSFETGRVERIVGTRAFTYLAGHSIEIAGRAASSDPEVATCTLGLALAMRADLAADGGVVLQFAARHAAESGAPRSFELDLAATISVDQRVLANPTASGRVEVPSVHFQALAGAARLTAGATAIAYVAPLDAGRDDRRGLLLAFTLEALAPADPIFESGGRELIVRDVAGSLLRGAPRFRHVDAGYGAPLGDSGVSDDSGDPAFAQDLMVVDPLAIELGFEAFHAAVEPLAGNLPDDATVMPVLGYLVSIGGAGQIRDVGERVASALANPANDVVFGTAGGAGEERAAFALPAALGVAFAACGGSEAYLHDAEVEVAEGASIVAPTVVNLVTGRFVSLALGADPRGGKRVVLHYSAHHPIGAFEPLSSGHPTLPLERLDVTSGGGDVALRLAEPGARATIDAALPMLAPGGPRWVPLTIAWR